MPVESAADLASFFHVEEFADSAAYTPVGGVAISLAVIHVARAVTDRPTENHFFLRAVDVAAPQMGATIAHRGIDWIVLDWRGGDAGSGDGPGLDGGHSWQVRVARADRYDGLVLIEQGTAQDDGYTSNETIDWQAYGWSLAVVAFGRGDEKREAAREGSVVPATFRLPWTTETAAITASHRLRYPVDPLDSDAAPVWDIIAVAPFGLNEAVEIVARRREA